MQLNNEVLQGFEKMGLSINEGIAFRPIGPKARRAVDAILASPTTWKPYGLEMGL